MTIGGGRPGPKRRPVVLLLAAVAAVVLGTAAGASSLARVAQAAIGKQSDWVLSTTQFSNDFTRAPYVGNGYIGQRIPGAGMGFYAGDQGINTWPTFIPRITTGIASGVYGDTPSVYGDLQAIATLPTWTTLTFDSPSGTYGPSTLSADQLSGYTQSLDLRSGTVTTSGTWTAPGGEQTRFVYRVFTDRARKHIGVVSLDLTPMWSGTASVEGLLDGAGARRLDPENAGVDTSTHTSYVTSTSTGVGIPVAESAVLLSSSNVKPTADLPIALLPAQSAGERESFAVTSGTTYFFSKYVAVVTGRDSFNPSGDATTESRQAAQFGLAKLQTENTAAWNSVWASDILVAGAPALQRAVRASEYSLYASFRSDSPSAIGPSGLGAESYGGLVFWDDDTWMFPALLAQHPDIARVIVDYRYRTLGAARANATENGYAGAFYPWTSAYDGVFDSNCYGVVHVGDQIIDSNRSCTQELHLQGDIALAQWQYYTATGDGTWLAARGWPVFAGIADFWASKARAGPDGNYTIDNVQPPDENHTGVNNSSYTNAVAALALERATQVAQITGHAAPASWSAIAAGLEKTMPYDSTNGLYLEYDGYNGATIKQADTVMLTYPLEFPMPFQVGVNDLDYYAPRTSLSGPAMTDSIHSIDASALDIPGCSAYTYLLRGSEPFLRDPYLEFSEVRAPDYVSAYSFLTGVGGFLQTFLYGFSGLRMHADAVHLDPSLPPQLQGVTLPSLKWQGRTFTIKIGLASTTVTLTSGPPLPLETPAGTQTVPTGGTLTIPTRRPDLQPTTNLDRCKSTSASSFVLGDDPVAAVDGSPATSWMPTSTATDQWLSADLSQSKPIDKVIVDRATTQFDYSVQISGNGKSWTTVGSSPATSTGTDTVAFGPRTARFVRLWFPAAQPTDTSAPTPAIANVAVLGP
jgi:trehalose/maltose hydrolase-like predicted phosphorylase